MTSRISKLNDTQPLESDRRWQAVMERDSSFDGQFVYSVATTGIYCRPSCGAKLANPQNVQFHLNGSQAEAAGFRSCKRCRPDEPSLIEQHSVTIARVCRFIEGSSENRTSKELAAFAGMSTYHFHRLFKQITGVTPKAYADADRLKRFRESLSADGTTITEAICDAGFNSMSRFYEKSNAKLGMTPRALKSGAAKIEIQFALGDCSLGSVLVAQSKVGICAIMLGDGTDELLQELGVRFPGATMVPADEEFRKLIGTIMKFIEAPTSKFPLPLDIRGTAFQQRVWQALQNIPCGKTMSYAEIAQSMGAPDAVRAVGTACGANPLAVAIPCHRVVRTDGALSGYRWGIERKRQLLEREAKQSDNTYEFQS